MLKLIEISTTWRCACNHSGRTGDGFDLVVTAAGFDLDTDQRHVGKTLGAEGVIAIAEVKPQIRTPPRSGNFTKAIPTTTFLLGCLEFMHKTDHGSPRRAAPLTAFSSSHR